MVEIALALAIVAVGVAGVMAIFPVGLSLTKAAVADNVVPDTAGYLLGYLETMAKVKWRDGSGNPVSNVFLNGFGTAKPVESASDSYTDTGIDDIKKNNVTDGIFKIEKKSKIDSGGTEVTDFSAIALVWRDNTTTIYDSGPSGTDYFATLFMEISWPADIDYAKREKRTYRLELFNSAYIHP